MAYHALATAFFLLVATTPAFAAENGPVEELRNRVDRAVQVLNDPAVKGSAGLAERRVRIRKIADEIFAFEEMAKRAMGVHWQQLPAPERERFVRLFSDLLDRAYFEKIDSYNGEKVTYLQTKVEGDQATIPTRVITPKGTDIPVEYRMLRDKGRWMVYDVIIEGVSLVANYRAQFDRIIRTASVDELLRRMESQVAGQASVGPAASTGPKPRGAGRE
jgi:phospholipid transport system substrate-binding protein